MFTGLSAFPLTPFQGDKVDEAAFAAIIDRLREAGAHSITAMGSTGSYAYLSLDQRRRVAEIALAHAGETPVFMGIGALRTSDVVASARIAEEIGIRGLLLAPVSYQPLTDTDVFELFNTVTAETSLPVIVYDNPGTTHFSFSIPLIERVAALPGIASVKIPGVSPNPAEARTRIDAYRAVVPESVTLGVAGDAFATSGLLAGADAWYSVIGGTLPQAALQLFRAAEAARGSDEAAADEASAAQTADAETTAANPTAAEAAALRASARLEPIWELFAEFGSVRVVAAIAEELGLATQSCLPLPIQGLDAAARERVAEAMRYLRLS